VTGGKSGTAAKQVCYNIPMIGRFLIIFFLLLPLAPASARDTAETPLEYDLRVSFDVPSSKILGTARIQIPREQELKLFTNHLKIISVAFKGAPFAFREKGKSLTLSLPAEGELEIRYEGIFKGDRSSLDPDNLRFPSAIDKRGLWLTGTWYPRPESTARYQLQALLPKGYEAVSEAEEVDKETRRDETLFSFRFPHPLESLNLIATDRYFIGKAEYRDVEIFTYFFENNRPLSANYLDRTRKYLQLYEGLLGRYPYKRFAVVENFLPTGYAMPTFTLLGSGVIRLPFIVETSLGHEILHQWFGSLVFSDYAGGNWTEGLTTYLADHLYEEEKGSGWEYRKKILIDYQSYVNAGNDFPLQEFQSRRDGATEAVGYGKGLLFFHMLRKWTGENHFFPALRTFIEENRFRRASWADLERAFEKQSGKDLGPFFNRWVRGKGVLDLEFEPEIRINPPAGPYHIVMSVRQRGLSRPFILPVSFYTSRGKTQKHFPIGEEKTKLEVVLEDPPFKAVIDEDYDLARKLTPREIPPVAAMLLGDKQTLAIRPVSQEERYAGVIAGLQQRGVILRDSRGVSADDLKNSSALFLGSGHPLVAQWFADFPEDAGFSLAVKKNPWNPEKVIGLVRAKSREEADAAFPKIRHYGKYSRIAFNSGNNILKEVEPSERGITRKLLDEPMAVEIAKMKSLPEILDQAGERKIIYLGESHDQFSHHLMQLEVIKELHRRGKRMAIGMEMFQQPFQKALDDYVAGRIDERELLKRSEYFRRWGFDFALYRPILRFAREKKIPVVALNAPKEITEKVAKGGLDVLTAEEKGKIPSAMDFADEGYKERLRKTFEEHKSFGVRNLDFFIQAQILWDEAMAEAIDAFLKGNPERQMVVLAGSGHVAFGSGIPKRCFRRNGFSYSVTLNEGPMEKNSADFVLFPGSVSFEGSPKLMIMLKEERDGLTVSEISEESVSRKAGMQEGDIILALDEQPVLNLEDVRLELAFRKKGEQIRVKVRREESSGEKKEITLQVTL
jgi:uncharacterized iron-regulated protein